MSDPDRDILAKLDRKERIKKLVSATGIGVFSIVVGGLTFWSLDHGFGLPERSALDFGVVVACVLSVFLAKYRRLI